MSLENEKEAQKICNETPYSLDGYGIQWTNLTNRQILKLAHKAIRRGRELEAEAFRVQCTEIADYLNDARDEPFPLGTEMDRLHYWRDKTIHASQSLRGIFASDPIAVAEVEITPTEKLERRVDALANMMDRILTLMGSSDTTKPRN